LRNEANLFQATFFLKFAEVGEALVEAAVGGGMVAHEETEFARVAFAVIGRHEVLVHEFFGALLREKVLRYFVDEDLFGGVDGLVLVA